MSSVINVATTATDRPPALDDRALLGHPRGLGLLFITEMWERFSFYGMRALLILYLVNALKWDTASAANLYGTYTMSVYLTPIIGGYLADRFIGTRRSLVLGGIIIALGHFTLAFPGMQMFYAGLTLIVIGTGFFKPNVSTMVGQIYPAGDSRRDAGFTIFYMGINLGAFLGPLVCGYLAQTPGYGWHWGFAAAGVGMVLGLVVYVSLRDKYLPGIGVRFKEEPKPGALAEALDRATIMQAGGGALAGVLIGGFTTDWGLIGISMGAIIGAALGLAILGSHGAERKRVIALFIVAFFVVFFWAAYDQTGSSMSLFADRNTNLQLGSTTLRSSWFQSVNPAVILLFAPLFAWLWVWLGRRGLEPSTALKMVIGLTLLGIGFIFLAIGGRHADAGVLVSPLWLIAAFTFHTWGELCLSPVGLSYVTKVAPARFASLLMGVWFLANGVADKIAGWLASFTPEPGAPARAVGGLGSIIQQFSTSHFGFFSMFVVIGLGAALMMLLFVPLLKRLTSDVKA
ncbi:MAG TPA: peptide MFS transporter [Gemmatimonadaceae bacterium]